MKGKSEEVFKARSHKEIKAREKQNNQDKLKEILTKEKRWQYELEMMVERRKVRHSERINLQTHQKEWEKEIAVREKNLANQSEKVLTKENLLSKMREQQQENQQHHLSLLKNQNQCESELKQTVIRLENMQDRRKACQERADKISQAINELAKGIEDKKEQLKEASKIVDDQKNSFSLMEQTLSDLSEEILKTQIDLDIAQQDITEGKARQKVLLRLREEMEGFSAGTKRLLQEAANQKSPLFGKLKGLHETITPEVGSEKALAAVMRPYVQTLVVETSVDFQVVMAFAKQENLKDFSLFCRETKMNQSILESKQEMTPLLKRVNDHPLSRHFLGSVWMAHGELNEWSFVRKNIGCEVCIEEGTFIDRHQVVFYKSQGESNIFLREAELKILAKKLKEADDNKQQLDNFLKALHQKKNQLQADRFELDKGIRRQEMKIVEINFTLQKLNGDQKSRQTENDQLLAELEGLFLSIEKFSLHVENLRQQSQEAHLKAAEAQRQVTSFNQEFDQRVIEHKQQLQELKEKESAYHKAVDENHRLKHALHILDVKDLESQQQEKRLEEEIELCQSLQTDSQLKGQEYEKVLQEVESSLADVVAACAELEQEVAARKTVIEHIDSKIQEKRNQLKKIELSHNQSELQTAQLDSQRQSLENELLERYQLSIEEAQQTIEPLEQTLDATEKRIRSLRQDLQNAGDVNMTSIEDCDKHKNRYEFLNQQIDDLNVSKKELIEFITQLDAESRKIFKETFDKICTNFKKNFNILFNGGEADLQFTETEDVLEAGIEIIAKPPGKQMRSINLLSGGEKCLTAVALLFALFEVKPSPFCILDEIDAPLDDTNVERFANIVKQYIDKCQFIIITHNKRTMAIADILFGVSMEEKGVSKLLSMEFSKDEAAVPVLV